jgi:ATP-dependent Clp protease ATP-binding subunit ClpC
MRRAVERFLEDPFAEELLRGNVKAGDVVHVVAEEGKLVFKAAEPQSTPAASAS